ncbi:MAG: CDP-alcohol phosphatidyltransferase family protein [Clostridiales bacterium]|nr:CDP-alcohol phosphatidyltransferase family protein [Clostridiales bacterium]
MRAKPKKEDLFTIPNILCYIRILLVPIFIWVFLQEWYWQSALVAIIASITDIVDGWIARKFDMISDWGKFIDPVADKLMQFAMLTVSIIKVPWIIILVIVFVVKESILLVVGLFIYHKGKNLDGAIWCGKLCTVVLDVSMLMIIAFPMDWLTDKLVFTLIGAVLAFMALSFVVYLNEYFKLYKVTKSESLIEKKISKE